MSHQKRQIVKHRAKNIDPRIRELADEIGLPISRRGGELWLDGDLQLTYQKRRVDGRLRDCTESDRVEIAVRILTSVIEARREWGTLEERWERVLAGLRETLPRYVDKTYTYYREPSLDCGWMIRTRFSPQWDMAIELVGEAQVRVSDVTADGCLRKLQSSLESRF